jgi:16S rRNA (guanine527-N7)-methyltransferase
MKSNDTNGQSRTRLLRGLASMGLTSQPKWTSSYNLVARGDRDALIGRHLMDSLSIHRFVGPGPLLDAGSGAGFPGIPLAIVSPGLEVTLLDSSGKKARFMRHVKRSLDLENVQIEHSRLEEFSPDEVFASIVCRAYGSLTEFATGVRHLAAPGTHFLAMKGRMPERELQELPDWVHVDSVERISVPDLHAERHLVIMCLSPGIA